MLLIAGAGLTSVCCYCLPLLVVGSGGSGFSSAPGSATAAAAAAQGQPDWAAATYDVMSPTEAAQLAATPAEVAANAALNLGSASGGAAVGQEGLVMHARRMSGGGNIMKMVSNLKAIEEEGDKPVHVIQTDTAVTEVYGHGLTIIRATDSVKKVRVVGLLFLVVLSREGRLRFACFDKKELSRQCWESGRAVAMLQLLLCLSGVLSSCSNRRAPAVLCCADVCNPKLRQDT